MTAAAQLPVRLDGGRPSRATELGDSGRSCVSVWLSSDVRAVLCHLGGRRCSAVVDSEAVDYMHGRRGDECGGQERLGDRPGLAEASLSATKARTQQCRIAKACCTCWLTGTTQEKYNNVIFLLS